MQIEGAKIRNSPRIEKEGVNVNFVTALSPERFEVRTYERGIESETLSCGTGATAVAIAMHASKQTKKQLIDLQTKGGDLEVRFRAENSNYVDIWLSGSTNFVFEGILTK